MRRAVCQTPLPPSRRLRRSEVDDALGRMGRDDERLLRWSYGHGAPRLADAEIARRLGVEAGRVAGLRAAAFERLVAGLSRRPLGG